MPESEFVSISRASQLLEAPERTVRRMADKLADTDRQLADTGGQKVKLVRLSALAHLMGREIVADTGRHSDDSDSIATQESADLLARIAELENLVADSGRQLADKEKALSDKEKELLESQKVAAVAEAEKRGLEARLDDAQKVVADTASDRDAWKEQAQTLTEALRAAQDEARAARLIGGRTVQQIEAHAASAGDSGEVLASGQTSDHPGTVKAPWWAVWKKRG